ncbi:MAG: choice-of-anchor B family protein [Flavobacteriales bacterium]
MRTLLFLTIFFVGVSSMQAQNQNMNQLGTLDYQSLHNSDVSDIWGYTDGSGNEYAIVGVNDTGVSIVDVTDPTNPTEIYYSEEQFSTTWRDIKTHNQHAYIVNEGGGGLKIIDLSPLPGSTNLSEAVDSAGGMWSTAHNIYIDQDSVAYIFGSDYGQGGVIMLDLSNDPMNPSVIGTYDQAYVHDGVVRNDTLYACQIYTGEFAIIDVSDPSNPQILGTHASPNNFSHNAWISGDGDHLYTTDEVSNGYIGSYDVSDPSNIQELDRTQVTPGSGSIPHNTHFLNEYLVTSYYRDGVVIHDVKNPGNMVQTARFDVAPGQSGDGFNGAWGVYPWLPSGNLIVSDIEDGLHILGPTYERGCYLEGTVTDQSNGNPINNAEVRIMPDSIVDMTTITGDYANGIGTPGNYDVRYSEPTYFPDTASNVPLSRDSLTIQDMQLEPRPQYDVRVEFENASTGDPLEGAKLLLKRDGPNYSGTTGANGAVTLTGVYMGTYQIHGAKWGYLPYCMDGIQITSQDTITIPLDSGYADDFAVDLGWSVQNNSNTGHWERGDPQGTSVQGFPINPDDDNSNDCGLQAYVTGNQGTSASDDQVDTLTNILTSPKMDLSPYAAPVLDYDAWFVSGAQGGGFGDDTMFVQLAGGGQQISIDTVTPSFPIEWGLRQVDLQPYMSSFNDSVRIRFLAGDPNGNTITEAGVDRFRITGLTQSLGEATAEGKELKVSPIPFKGSFHIRWKGAEKVRIQLYDLKGRKLRSAQASGGLSRVLAKELRAGVYLLVVRDAETHRMIGRKRVVKEDPIH